MNKIKILALFGESGAGKDTIQRFLTNNYKDTNGIVSYTSRPPRENEQDGIDYYFISKKDFEILILTDQILEYTNFNDWYYGTGIDKLNLNKINIGVFNPQGIRNLLEHSDIIEVLPVWIKTDDKERLLRSLNRENFPNCKEICRRFLSDKEDFNNIDFNYETFLNTEDNHYSIHFFDNQKISNFVFSGQK